MSYQVVERRVSLVAAGAAPGLDQPAALFRLQPLLPRAAPAWSAGASAALTRPAAAARPAAHAPPRGSAPACGARGCRSAARRPRQPVPASVTSRGFTSGGSDERYVEAQLDRGGHLVDVLAAGPGRADEALLDFALVDADVVGDGDLDRWGARSLDSGSASMPDLPPSPRLRRTAVASAEAGQVGRTSAGSQLEQPLAQDARLQAADRSCARWSWTRRGCRPA